MKNKRIEKTFQESEWKELKRIRNRVKSGKEKPAALQQALFNAARKEN